MTEAPSDEMLMLAYAAGDADAFAALYDRHAAPVYRYFLRNLRDAHAAQDLLQEAWLAVVRSANRYEARARFTTWLYGIAHSKLVDHLRAQRPQASLDAANDPDDANTPLDRLADASAYEPQERACSRAEARAFLAQVEALPEAQRVAFLLHAEGGLNADEIGALTGVGAQTAKSRLRYALAKLRAGMEEWR